MPESESLLCAPIHRGNISKPQGW